MTFFTFFSSFPVKGRGQINSVKYLLVGIYNYHHKVFSKHLSEATRKCKPVTKPVNYWATANQLSNKQTLDSEGVPYLRYLYLW